ncbi:hypothetical protein M3D75_01505 [Microbacterium enclense]|nr:hypothetical protein [Microbacterium enclense]MCT2084786.1 hypothetical protein [Microbacterium enclense]
MPRRAVGRRGALDPRPLEPGDEVRMVIEGDGGIVTSSGSASQRTR